MLRTDAIRLGEPRYFTGKPCKFGHVSERFTSNGACCDCQRGKREQYARAVAARELGWTEITVSVPRANIPVLQACLEVLLLSGADASSRVVTLATVARSLAPPADMRQAGARMRVRHRAPAVRQVDAGDEQAPGPDPEWITQPVEPPAPSLLSMVTPRPPVDGVAP